MAKMTTTRPTQRLKILADYVESPAIYYRDSVVDVRDPLAAELVRTGQAEATTAPLRLPLWATCPRCASSWIATRVLDGRHVKRFTDDADQTPWWTQCRCGAGWLR